MRNYLRFFIPAAFLFFGTSAEASKLTSGSFWLEGNVYRITCGVTYKGTEPTQVKVEIFNFADPVLNPNSTLDLSPDNPAGAFRTLGCPNEGCASPWCQVTTTVKKTLFRATMCVEGYNSQSGAFNPVTCVPVD
jgi:hypothetical protein